MSILLSLKNMCLSFGQKIIFDQAEITINKGDRIGLIGLNGQGKSTLFQIIQGNVFPDQSSPAFIYDKSAETFDIFLIPQELNIDGFPDLTPENYYLAFYPKLYSVFKKMNLAENQGDLDLMQEFESLGGWEIQNAYVNYLKGFGLTELDRNLQRLSGGEKRKMALSAGLSSKAELLLWDEPTNHLDTQTIEAFEEELLNSQKTYMIISHDRYLLNYITKKTCHIQRGKITNFSGNYLDYLVYLENKSLELKKNLDKMENKHRRELAWMRQGIKARGTRSKKRVSTFENLGQDIQDIKRQARKTAQFDLKHSGRQSKILVEIKDGSFAYQNKVIFEELNLLLTKQDKIALMGRNGVGKSTLVKILKEELKLSSGTQKNADGIQVGVFDQHREALQANKTAFELVGEGSDFIVLSDGSRKHINSYLESFLFHKDQLYRPVSYLSGGEKNRLQLAMFMKRSADLWVFDEPTNDLDIETIELLEAELKAYQGAVVIIGHDRSFLDNTCDKTWLIHNRKIEMFEGGYSQIAAYLNSLTEEEDVPVKAQEVQIKREQTKSNQREKNQQKKHLEKLEKSIEALEQTLNKLNHQLSQFNYSDMNAEKNQKVKILGQEKTSCEQKLQDLYVEWEKAQEDN